MTTCHPLPSQTVEMARGQLARSRHLLNCLLANTEKPADELQHWRRLARLAFVIIEQEKEAARVEREAA